LPDLLQTITIAAPINAVWAELTKLSAKQRAMMDTVLSTTFEPGAPLLYKSPDGKIAFIVGRIIEATAPHRLVHSWQLTTRDDPPTVVTWELEEIEDGTRVTLRHTGFPEGTEKLDGVDRTWLMILRELKRLLETGDISRELKVRYAVMRRFMWAMPAKTRTGNVTIPELPGD
jgi:uncharacterized protein YndB with AHSA1/START domain